MKKNIWILNHYSKVNEGRHYNFALKLIEKGYNVKMICASTSIKSKDVKFVGNQNTILENYNNIEYIIVKSRDYVGNGRERFKNMFDYSLGSFKFLKKKHLDKPDVIYASSVHPLTWVVGYLIARKHNAKLIIETRDLWPETLIKMGRIKAKSLPAKMLYKLEKFMYQKADYLIFTMPGGKKYLEEKKYKYKKYCYINNGVDLKLFNENKEKHSNNYFAQNNNFNVIYTGSMGIANSVHTIIDAAKYLQNNNYKNINFHLFGDGYLRNELIDYVDQLKLTNVTFYGRVDKEKIPAILSSGDLNIATSQNISLYDYGVSLNKYFDYFASGKPTITNIPSPYSKIEKYKCGMQVEPEDPEKLALGIVKISELENEEYTKMCSNATNAAEEFDYGNLVNKLDRVIKGFESPKDEKS